MKVCKTKDRDKFFLKIVEFDQDDTIEYKIFAISKDIPILLLDNPLKTLNMPEFIGATYFKIYKSTNTSWLTNIYIHNEDWANKGVGSIMLDEFENKLRMNNVKEVKGFFFPYGNLNNLSMNFYRRNGYEVITKDFSEFQIHKEIDKTGKNSPEFLHKQIQQKRVASIITEANNYFFNQSEQARIN